MSVLSGSRAMKGLLFSAAVGGLLVAYWTYDTAKTRYQRSLETRMLFQARYPDIPRFHRDINSAAPVELGSRLLGSPTVDEGVVEAQALVRGLARKFSIKLQSIQTAANPDNNSREFSEISIIVAALADEADVLLFLDAIDRAKPSILLDTVTLQKVARSQNDRSTVTLAARMAVFARVKGGAQ